MSSFLEYTRLQQLVEPKPEPAESNKIVQPSSTSILRPAQLVLKTATNPVPRIPALPKELTTKLPKVRNSSPAKYDVYNLIIGSSLMSNLFPQIILTDQTASKGQTKRPLPIPWDAHLSWNKATVKEYQGQSFAESVGPFAATLLFFRRANLAPSVASRAANLSPVCFAPGCLSSARLAAATVSSLQCIDGILLVRPKKSQVCQLLIVVQGALTFHNSHSSLCSSDGEVMTARCKACWLKLALTGFQMREADHDDLRKLLPTFMQDAIPLAIDRPTVIHWAPNRGQMIRMKSNSSSTPNVTSYQISYFIYSFLFK